MLRALLDAECGDDLRFTVRSRRHHWKKHMKNENEIDELLGPVSRKQMAAAITAINGYGFDISAPWECDQDDREFEMFCGLLAAVTAAHQTP